MTETQVNSFKLISEKMNNEEYLRSGIGTLGEKSLHRVLKFFLEPDEKNHEIKVGGYVADIANDGGIIEIQTRQFDKLRKKLDAFLEQNKVRVVYPIPGNKWLIWIDEESGETTKKRKSPKTGRPFDIFPELYKIKQYLTHDNLSFYIMMIDMEEYRLLNGWSNDKKKGSTRFNRIPVGLKGIVEIDQAPDFVKLVPEGLPEEFTSKDFKMRSGLSMNAAYKALNVLSYVGVVEKLGKRGRLQLYRVAGMHYPKRGIRAGISDNGMPGQRL